MDHGIDVDVAVVKNSQAMTTTSTTEEIIHRTLNYTTKFITTTLTTKGEEKDHHISRLGWLKWLVNKYLHDR